MTSTNATNTALTSEQKDHAIEDLLGVLSKNGINSSTFLCLNKSQQNLMHTLYELTALYDTKLSLQSLSVFFIENPDIKRFQISEENYSDGAYCESYFCISINGQSTNRSRSSVSPEVQKLCQTVSNYLADSHLDFLRSLSYLDCITAQVSMSDILSKETIAVLDKLDSYERRAIDEHLGAPSPRPAGSNIKI